MKKLSLLVGGLILTGAVMAQKPADGAPMSLEGGLGFNASTLTFDAPQIRFRYFLSENLAVRLTVGINNGKTVDTYYQNADGSGTEGTYEVKTASTQFGLGAEYHFAGTEKLSPYAGLNIMFGMGGTKITGKDANAGGFNAGYTRDYEAKTSMFGVSLVGGADYYFAENFYIGTELGLMFGASANKDASDNINGTTTVTGGTKVSGISTNFTGSFRLGWRF